MGWTLNQLTSAKTSYKLVDFPFKIGRNLSADIICPVTNISKNHAHITTSNGQLYITDTSTNGVFINHVRIPFNMPTHIKANDIISLCYPKDNNETGKEHFLYELISDQNDIQTELNIKVEARHSETNENMGVIKSEVRPENNQNVESFDVEANNSVNNEINETIKMEVNRSNIDKSCEIIEIDASSSSEQNYNQCDNKQSIGDAITIKTDSDVQIITQDIADDIIVIDDEEENMILSQLFIKHEVKQEVDEEFLKIKEEIAEMDRCDNEYNALTYEIEDSDDDDDDTSDELLMRLQNYSPDVRYLDPDKSPELLFVKSPEYDVQSLVTDVVAEKSPELVVEPPSVSVTKDLKEISEHIAAKQTKNQLEIIPALPLEAKSRKRKSDLVKKPAKSKKSKSETTNAATCKNTSKINEKKTQTSKHRELFEGESSDNKKTKKASVKVKVSDNRGLFLTTEPQPAKKKKKPVPVAAVLPSIPKKAAAAVSKEVPLRLQASTSQPVKAVATVLPSPKPKTPLPQVNTLNPRISNTSQANLTRDPRIAKRPPSNTKLEARTYPQNTMQLIMSHKAFVLRLFEWKNSFFENVDISAIWMNIEGSPLIKMPTTYSDYRYYQRAMNAVVMSELFSDVSNEYNSTPFAVVGDRVNRGSLGLRVKVLKIDRHEDYTEIHCFYYIGEKQLSDKLCDCYLLNFIPWQGQSKTMANSENCLFGVVGWTRTEKLGQTEHIDPLLKQQCKSSPWHKHMFSILTRRTTNIQAQNYLFLRNFGSIRRFLKKLSAIQKVEGVIAQQILSPDPSQYLIPDFPMPNKLHHFLRMNQKQEEVVNHAMRFCTLSSNSRFFMVQGPPGTGKSDLVVNITLNFLKNLDKGIAILLLAQSNAAVENLVRRIVMLRKDFPKPLKDRVRIIRMGRNSQSAADLADYHVDNHVARHLRSMLFQQAPHLMHSYRVLEEEVFALRAMKIKTGVQIQTLEKKEREYANFVRNHYLQQYHREEAQVRNLVFEKATLICSTIGSSYAFPSRKLQLKFKCCIIDEATQATEPDTLLPLTQDVNKFILVGDTRQLPPHQTLVPKEYLFSRSLFVRLQKVLRDAPSHNALHLLDTQYRMREEICSFPNRQFYCDKLITHPQPCREDIKTLAPYLVFEVNEGNKTKTYVNLKEIEAILMILLTISRLKLESQLTIGIITPYNEQRIELQKQVETLNLNRRMKVLVNTIDGFQGQEQDIILLSLVLRMANSFVNDAQRLNVALTRARSCLYVFGSPILFESGSLIRSLKKDAIDREMYVRLPQYFDPNSFQYCLFR